MEDFLGILILIIYLIAAASGKGKKANKKRKRAGRNLSRQSAPDFARAFDAASDRRSEPADHPGASMPMETACESRRIHLHEVEQEAFHAASEGEDPCHAGEAPAQEDTDAFALYEAEDEQRALAQDILRGVVMSEILTRPCDRAALKRNRRSIV